MNIRKAIAIFTAVAAMMGNIFIPSYTAEAKQKSTINIDLNNDGKKEKIQFKLGKKYYEWKQNLYVYVNGKKKRTFKGYWYDYGYKILSMPDGKKILYINTEGEDSDGVSLFLGYKGGTLKTIFDPCKYYNCRWAYDIRSKDGKINLVIQDSNAPGTGNTAYNTTLIYNNGSLEPESDTIDVAWYTWSDEDGNSGQDTSERLVIEPFKLYSDKDCKKYLNTVLTDDDPYIRVTQRYDGDGVTSYHAIGSGYDGWYSASDYKEYIDNYDWNDMSESLYYLEGCGGVG